MTKPKILIVEDEAGIRRFVRQSCSRVRVQLRRARVVSDGHDISSRVRLGRIKIRARGLKRTARSRAIKSLCGEL